MVVGNGCTCLDKSEGLATLRRKKFGERDEPGRRRLAVAWCQESIPQLGARIHKTDMVGAERRDGEGRGACTCAR